MPNHVTNRLSIKSPDETIAEIFGTHITGHEEQERKFDFQTLIPMPALLSQIQDGPCDIDGEEVKYWILDIETRKPRKLTPEEVAEQEKSGFKSWYDFSRKKWGTKWNSYDLNEEKRASGCICFDTAWSPPVPVIQELSRRYPAALIELSYVDEGWNFTGSQTWKAGNLLIETDIPCEKSNPIFCAICLELKGYDPSAPEAE